MKTTFTPCFFAILLCIFCLQSNFSKGQSVAINTDGSTASSTAILDVKSTTKGLLIPRMTTVQRTAIATPATGLLVFDTDVNAFWYYNGSTWIKLESAGANWSTTGNSGTAPATNFIGSTDAKDVVVKTNGTERMRWKSAAASHNEIVLIGSGDLQVNGVNVGVGPGNIASNIVAGYQALYGNTTGSVNTALGYQALYSNSTGSYNTASGYQAMASNTSGSYNTAFGLFSLYSNNTGHENTAVGVRALFLNTDGYYNTATGLGAMFYNSSGYGNTATGTNALLTNTTGTYNTAIGSFSLNNSNIGNHNTAVGYNSLVNNTGDYNTACGSQSLTTNNSGSYNTVLGYLADVSTNGLSNATAIGYGASVNASNKVVIGNTSVTVIGGVVGWSTLSDGRFKTNVKEDVPGLNFIMQLRPVSYNLLSHKFDEHLHQNSKAGNKTDKIIGYSEAEKVAYTGFIAQEVEQVVKKNGYKFGAVHTPDNATDNYSIAYDQFVVPLVKAVQQQQKQIDEQKKIINQQQRMLEDLKNRLDKLEQK